MALSVGVLAYDIAHDRRRARAYRLLSAYGVPLQESVFLLELTTGQWTELQRKLKALVRTDEDVVHVWPLCGACVGRAELWSGAPRSGPGALAII